MTSIDWSQMKSSEQIEEECRQSEYIVISRKSGLFWIYDNLGVTEDQLLAKIDLIENEAERYKSKISFNTGFWYSNDPYVKELGKTLGLDTDEKLLKAFQEATKL